MMDRSRRVLIVTASEALDQMLSTMLSLAGHQARRVSTCGAALARLRRWQPDLLLLDFGPHDWEGLACLHEVRRRTKLDIPVLILTGLELSASERAALAAPVLRKPFRLDDLLQTVGRLAAIAGGPGANRPLATSSRPVRSRPTA